MLPVTSKGPTHDHTTDVDAIHAVHKNIRTFLIATGLLQLVVYVGTNLLKSSDEIQEWALRNQWLIYVAITVTLGGPLGSIKYPRIRSSVLFRAVFLVSLVYMLGTPFLFRSETDGPFSSPCWYMLAVSELAAAASFYPLERAYDLRRMAMFALTSYVITAPLWMYLASVTLSSVLSTASATIATMLMVYIIHAMYLKEVSKIES